MTSERIKEIQEKTAYTESVSVQQALFQVWNECEQESKSKLRNMEKTLRDELAMSLESSAIQV